MMAHLRIIFAVLASIIFAVPTSAEAGQGAIVGGVVAAAAMESKTQASVAGSISYRVNRFLGLGMEITSVPALKSDVATLRPSTVIDSFGSAVVLNSRPATIASGTDGRATVFTGNVRVEIPSFSARFIPYVVGGGGVANVKDRFTVTLPVPVSGIPVVIQPQSVTQSSTALALTVGGGVSTLVAPHVSIDVDLRYLRFITNRDLNVGRFGIGFSYRF